MSGVPGYVHISQRVRSAAQQALEQSQNPPFSFSPQSAAHLRPMSAMQPDLSQQQVPQQDSEARGFVLYVGLSEEAAAANGTSLVRIVQDLRAYAHSLVPESDSYAAVALAPEGAEGTDLEVVRNALGDPTAVHQPEEIYAQNINTVNPNDSMGVLVDLARREVYLDGEKLTLTYKEFELLHYLIENSERTVKREELLGKLWRRAEDVPNVRTIDVHIRRLRTKLGRLSHTLRTIRGQGYRFFEHPEVVVWAAPEYTI